MIGDMCPTVRDEESQESINHSSTQATIRCPSVGDIAAIGGSDSPKRTKRTTVANKDMV